MWYLKHSRDQTIPQRSKMCILPVYICVCQTQRLRSTNNTCNILRPSPSTTLLRATLNLRQNTHPLTHIQDACSLRTIKLMGRKREQVDIESRYINGQCASSLDCIHMERDLACPTNPT